MNLIDAIHVGALDLIEIPIFHIVRCSNFHDSAGLWKWKARRRRCGCRRRCRRTHTHADIFQDLAEYTWAHLETDRLMILDVFPSSRCWARAQVNLNNISLFTYFSLHFSLPLPSLSLPPLGPFQLFCPSLSLTLLSSPCSFQSSPSLLISCFPSLFLPLLLPLSILGICSTQPNPSSTTLIPTTAMTYPSALLSIYLPPLPASVISPSNPFTSSSA